MKNITVLLTCVGGLTAPGKIKSFKSVTERKIKLIGVDMNENCAGAYLSDKFYKVPAGSDERYVDAMLSICKKEKVDVVLPSVDEEAISLSKNKRRFEEIGTKIAVSDYNKVKVALNKALFCEFLKENKIPHPKFFLPKSVDQLIKYTKLLGYPDEPVVMKPIISRGGRGARIILNNQMKDIIINEKPETMNTTLEQLVQAFEKTEFPDVILMEYLPGEFYSVDILARRGAPLIIVPKIRVIGTPSQTLVGVVNKNNEVERIATKICKAFGFDYNVNIEMKYSKDGTPLPYDINPRVAASVAFCTAAGANLLYYAVKLALGEKIPRVSVKNGVTMIRYFEEMYLLNNRRVFI